MEVLHKRDKIELGETWGGWGHTGNLQFSEKMKNVSYCSTDMCSENNNNLNLYYLVTCVANL